MYLLSFSICVLLVSFLLERLHKPQIIFSSGAAKLMHVLTFMFLTVIFLIATQRIYISLLGALGFHIAAVMVSNTKYQLLKEPLIFSDLVLVTEAVRFPRLYLPFLGLLCVIILMGSAIFLVVATYFEMAWQFLSVRFYIRDIFYLAALGVFYFSMYSLSKKVRLSLMPTEDVKNNGVLATLALYYFGALINKKALTSTIGKMAVKHNMQQKPHIIAIQSESFFDARKLHPNVHSDVLHQFDLLCQQSLAYGELVTPAWGAYTMRSEFSFLTGVANNDLSFGRFHPYNYFRNKSIITIATQLKQQGYRCVCIHPFHKSFFNRDKIFSNLGFDDFYDIKSFNNAETFGPYISDASVYQKITEELKNSEQPVFLFVITIENHGPYHLETIEENELSQYVDPPYLKTAKQLGVYLRHLANADRMIANLTMYLKQHHEDALLLWYGDHVAEMPEVYHEVNYEEKNTNYLIWTARKSDKLPIKKAKPIEDLMEAALDFIN